MNALKSVNLPQGQEPAVGKRMDEVKATIEGVFNAVKDSTVFMPKDPVVGVTEPGMAMGGDARTACAYQDH